MIVFGPAGRTLVVTGDVTTPGLVKGWGGAAAAAPASASAATAAARVAWSALVIGASFVRAAGRGPCRKRLPRRGSAVVTEIRDLTDSSGISGSDFARARVQNRPVGRTVLIVDDHPSFRRFARS